MSGCHWDILGLATRNVAWTVWLFFFLNHLSIWSVFFTWDIWVCIFIYAPICTRATLKYMFVYTYIYTYIHDNHTSFCGRTSIQTRPKVYHPQVTPCGCSNCRKSLAGSPGITSVLPCENRAGFFWCRRLSSRVVWGKVALGCFDKGWKEVVMHEGFPVCGCFYDLDVLFIREFILTNPSFLSWLLGKLNGSIFCGSGIILKGQRFCYVYKYIYICMNGHGSCFSRHAYLYCFASWRMIFQGTMEQ